MVPSIRGGLLPESLADFNALKAGVPQYPRYRACYLCEKHFDASNVETAMGWRETQISGTCETCYDELFADAEDSGVDEL